MATFILHTHTHTHIHHRGWSRFMSGLCSWKTSQKSNTQFPFKTVCFRVRWLTASTCKVYDYTISGYTDL